MVMKLLGEIDISLEYPFQKFMALVEGSWEWGQGNAAPVVERGRKVTPGNPRLYKVTLAFLCT